MASEADASGQLNLAWAEVARESPKLDIGLLTLCVELRRSIHGVEGRVIEQVVEFRAQLKTHFLFDGNVLKQSDVPIIDAWSAKDNLTCVADEVGILSVAADGVDRGLRDCTGAKVL